MRLESRTKWPKFLGVWFDTLNPKNRPMTKVSGHAFVIFYVRFRLFYIDLT